MVIKSPGVVVYLNEYKLFYNTFVFCKLAFCLKIIWIQFIEFDFTRSEIVKNNNIHILNNCIIEQKKGVSVFGELLCINILYIVCKCNWVERENRLEPVSK